ncbi:tetratricopeptide repeat protein [Nocardia sp. NRRL S-836]|uniref:tetratricopeptide repeat protein n=1 Tax=Nocardia sp. NRRL S-836 TaxID=1519492 RepID=UPI0006B00A32|nr:tetratricopeptide repeat protein [Nocardia sp. NRRL S-836]KOV87559.1 hypothetical protein ADL03_06565 [Nocardia sp. NRRL S-836]
MKLVWRQWYVWTNNLLAVILAITINLLTDDATTALIAFVAILAILQFVMARFQGEKEYRAQQSARDALLRPLQPPTPARTKSSSPLHLLTAPYSPTPLWGRTAERRALLKWCTDRDEGAGVVHVVSGPTGVGKSRLARAVAEDLPDEWASGWLLSADGLVERITACLEPTLVIVDDAEQIAELDTLVSQAILHPRSVRLLVLTQDAELLARQHHAIAAYLSQVTSLKPVGEFSDWQRWFGEAARSYARTLEIPPPNLPVETSFNSSDSMLTLHVRALVAALNRSGAHASTMRQLSTELAEIEQESWRTDLAGLPIGCDLSVLGEVVTTLSLLPAQNTHTAAGLLRRLPQFAEDSSQESRFALARWARSRYLSSPDHRLDLAPHLIGDRLVVDVLTRCPSLLDDGASAFPALVRAYTNYPDALPMLINCLLQQGNELVAGIRTVISTCSADRELDHALGDVVTQIDPNELKVLIGYRIPERFPQVRCAVGLMLVNRDRALTTEGVEQQARVNLANSLYELAIDLLKVDRADESLVAAVEAAALGRELAKSGPVHRQSTYAMYLTQCCDSSVAAGNLDNALTWAQESTDILRTLASDGPTHRQQDLARALQKQGMLLEHMDKTTEALSNLRESESIWRKRAADRPGKFEVQHAQSLVDLAHCLRSANQLRDALHTLEKAANTLSAVVQDGADEHRSSLAAAFQGLGTAHWELDQHQEAVEAAEAAVTIWRQLALEEPHRFRPELARAVGDFALCLSSAGQHTDALTHAQQAAAIWRELRRSNPGGHRAAVARATSYLAIILAESPDRRNDALVAGTTAIAEWKALRAEEPALYGAELAFALRNQGTTLLSAGERDQALITCNEAATLWRSLSDARPERHAPQYAVALGTVAACLSALGRTDDAIEAQRNAVRLWRECAQRDPELYESSYRSEWDLLNRLTGEVTPFN